MDVSIDLTTESAGPEPMYEQIAARIAAQIKSQALGPGTKLPPERQLAERCGVSRTTAINAYRRLEEMGLVRTRVGSGTYVAEGTGEAAAQPMPWHQLLVPAWQSPVSGIIRDLVAMDASAGVSMATGMPDPRLYPWAAFQGLLGQGSLAMSDLGHIATEGYGPLREALAARHAAAGVPARAENVAVVAGAQQGLYLLAKVFLNPGDYVIVEAPTYMGALQIFQSAGARLLTLPAPGPLQLDLLEDYLIRYRPKLMYVMPTYQNPSGRVMPQPERQALLALAARHRLAVIEDDPYSDLHYDREPPPPLKALDQHGGVIYLRTFSKTVFPGLRVGWVVAPEAVIHRLAQEKQYVDLHSNNLAQWLLYKFAVSGGLNEHLAAVRREYRQRRDAMAQALRRFAGERLSYVVPSGGFYFWCRVTAPGLTARTLLAEAGRQGVSFVPGDAFYPGTEGEREFRVCFATNEAAELQEGIRRLARAVAQAEKGGGQGPRRAAAPLPPII
jgi:DNA-binding transcriptional MocR family regulator